MTKKMRFTVLSILLSFAGSSAASDGAAQPTAKASAGSLTVVVTGVSEASGKLRAGLYKEAEFPKEGKAFKGILKSAKKGTVTLRFKEVPAGIYGVALYHDLNNNSKLDKNFMGIPKEDYAFSRNARGTFGPPDFSDASFEVKGDKKISIRLN